MAETGLIRGRDDQPRERKRWVSRAIVSGQVIFLLVVLLLGIWYVNRPLRGEGSIHFDISFSGDNDRLGKLSSSIGLDGLKSSLRRDTVYALTYSAAIVVAALGADGRRIRRNRTLKWWTISFAIAAGAADVAENLVSLSQVGTGVSGLQYSSSWAPYCLVALGSIKWFALLAGVALVLFRAASVLLPEAIIARPAVESPPPAPVGVPEGLGVCCSGGGIRAAAFALGALDALANSGVLLRKARYLSAVSGGNYAATAWTEAAATKPEEINPASVVLAQLTQPPLTENDHKGTRKVTSRKQFHRFLSHGSGGMFGRGTWAFGVVALHSIVLCGAVYLLAWPLGRLVSAPALWRDDLATSPDHLTFAPVLWMPGAALATVGGLLVVVSVLLRRLNHSTAASIVSHPGGILLGAGATSLLVIVGVPWLVVYPTIVSQKGATPGAVIATSATGIAALLLSQIWRQLKSLIAKRIVVLFGFLLAGLLAFVLGRAIVTDSALRSGFFERAAPWPFILLAILAAFAFFVPGIQWASLRPVYSSGLRNSFTVKDPEGDALTWTDLQGRTDLPELIVCCAAQRRGLSFGGIPAISFTVSPKTVRLEADYYSELAERDPSVHRKFDPTYRSVCVDTGVFLNEIKGTTLGRTMADPASWMAVSGAAFASAMGRQSKGSTNGALAALGINLGMWIPSPIALSEGLSALPLVRMGYYVKEIFGIYDAHDDYMFVSDGGHWDNLGLVELLRRRCQVIVCIDASGDKPGTYTTLDEAFEQAVISGIIVEKPDVSVSNAAVRAIKVEYAGDKVDNEAPFATVLHAKLGRFNELNGSVAAYAAHDKKFPNYSTVNQWLRDQQFAYLVEAGELAGRRAAEQIPRGEWFPTGDVEPSSPDVSMGPD